MTERPAPTGHLLEPQAVAAWLDTDVDWVLRAIAEDGLPVLGVRTDGVPLMATEDVQAWLRRPRLDDDCT